MLENSLWARYNATKTIREALSAIYGCDGRELNEDESELYAALKRHLTKKELRLFIMLESGMTESDAAAELGMDDAALRLAKQKAYRKVKQEKVRSETKMQVTDETA